MRDVEEGHEAGTAIAIAMEVTSHTGIMEDKLEYRISSCRRM